MVLTNEQIAKLASGKGVRKIAVENFLSTCGNVTTHHNLMNLAQDARAYGWNAATVAAIRKGIKLMGR